MDNGRFVQSVHPLSVAIGGAALGDIFNGNPASDVIKMSLHDRVTFLITKGAGATGTATVTVESCDDTTPTTATAIPFKYWASTSGDALGDMKTAAATGFATTAGANQLYAVEVSAAELSGTDKYVRLQLTEVVNDPCGGAVCAILSGCRYDDDKAISAV